MSRILAVGIATLDIVSEVDAHPGEDDEVRALARRIQCGGNAANTLIVLAQLGHRCALAATLADHPCTAPLREALARHRIDTSPCVTVPGALPPVSCVTLNRRRGGRSIVHHRALREYTWEDFRGVDLDGWDWLHFEGRNVEALAHMLDRARRAGARVSLELEKPRPGLDALVPRADVLLCSRRYALAAGRRRPEDFLAALAPRLAPGARAYLAWGEAGAWACSAGGGILHAPAWRPPRVVDSLGAGDCFNAGVIHGELTGRAPEAVLRDACRLAGRKCGQAGLEGLA